VSATLVAATALAWLLVGVAGSLAFTLAWPVLARHAARAARAGQLERVVGLASSPVAAASVVTTACYLPWLGARVGVAHDHCLYHVGHVHLCLEHFEAASVSPLAWGLGAAAAIWLVVGVWRTAKDLDRGLALVRALRAPAEHDAARGIDVIECEHATSFTAGLFSPRVYASSALVGRLDDRRLAAVLAHERCHVRERHALWKVGAALATLFVPSRVRHRLLDLVELACERRADEAAAVAIDDRLELADTLLAAQRGFPIASPALLSLAEGHVALRVRALLDPAPAMGRPLRSLARAGALLCAVAAVGSPALHHGVETVLSILGGR
jgi:Zn-dependent protease with chaperone function